MIERLLRSAAIAIAVLALIDPSLMLASRSRPRVSIVVQGGPSMTLPSPSGTSSRREAAERVRDMLRRDLLVEYEVVDGLDRAARAAIIIGDRYPDEPLADEVRVSTVTVSDAIAPNVRITAIDAPAAVLPATAVPIRVALDASGVRGQTSSVVVRIGSAEVGHASHEWTADRESWIASLDAVPLGEPPYSFEVTATPLTPERTPLDNHAVVRVDRRPPARVLVFEARPSWATAFVRRALEGDARFVVSAVGHAAPRAVVRSGAAAQWPLSQPETVDAILVGGLDRLSPADVEALDRFMRERGGAVALLPDAPFAATAARQLTTDVVLREALLDRAAALVMPSGTPRLDSSELLEAERLPPGATTLARAAASQRAVIWTVDRGDGRLLVSGAMDAWRYRAEPGVDLDRFWRSVVSGLAVAARPPVEVRLVPPHAAAGDRIAVRVRVRRLERERLGAALAVSARAGAGHPIRLWPDATPGTFTGQFIVARTDGTSIAVTASAGEGQSGAARLSIDESPREAVAAPLALLAETHGGVNVEPAGLAALERQLRASVRGDATREAARPMRSAWWLLPFASCLSAEWWLRRRRGER